MAFWWHRKCQGRDKTFILKALSNHLWMVSFYWVFISNRLIIDRGIIIFLDGFDVLGNGLTRYIIIELWHHHWTPGWTFYFVFSPIRILNRLFFSCCYCNMSEKVLNSCGYLSDVTISLGLFFLNVSWKQKYTVHILLYAVSILSVDNQICGWPEFSLKVVWKLHLSESLTQPPCCRKYFLQVKKKGQL